MRPMSAGGLRIERARLVDGTGRAPLGDAIIEVDPEGVIRHVGLPGPGGVGLAAAVPGDVQTIDAGGRIVLPGFFDCHVHLGFAYGVPPGRRYEEDPVHLVLDTAARLRQTLDAGITSARDLAGLPAGYRTAVETGRLEGPRLHTAVRIISHTGGHGDHRRPDGTDTTVGMTEFADTPDEVRLGIRRVLREGADVIKICATGGMASPYDQPEDEELTEAEIRAAVDEGRRHGGIPVAAHAQGTAGILAALRAGVTSLEHGYGIDERGLDLAGDQGTFLVPTLSTFDGISKDTMSPSHYQKKVRWSGMTKENIARAIQARVRIALGTDAAVGPHGRNLRELAHLVELGMTPMDAIVAGTRTSAQLLGVQDRLGTIETGKLADIVICDGDPLADIGILGDPANICLVIRHGVVRKNLLTAAQR
jgi:imidazolonepropionase-like amidohydrolase